MKKSVFLFVLTSLPLLFLSCTKSYELEPRDAGQYGYEVWQGHFIVQNGVKIPLLFGVEGKTDMRQVRLFSGSELAHWSYWHEGEDWHSTAFWRDKKGITQYYRKSFNASITQTRRA
ncbi:hypothetical protein M2306_000743 [Myroides gitamensis]|uniref:hypothetical protein n=1 Tax=Myroides odoratus TaxID=256 RepID=UPI00216A97EC|nr:hypothetical protein [Myroides odoratus]MCS4237975.1 hypothetical protein [Myroides odoratus]MDH6600049.1 hypothetical protein [Myroides gitamensis]